MIPVKICGMTRQQDADAAVSAGASLLGFIFHEPSPRNVSPEFAASIESGSALRVGVFVKQSVDEVLRIMQRAELDLAQLHGGQDESFCDAIGKERVIKVFWPEKFESQHDFQSELIRFADHAALYLCDAGKSGGGHGVPLNSPLLANATLPCPLLLAGGLNADNIMASVAAFRPAGVDLNSGLEFEPGKKDENKIRQAFAAIAPMSTATSEALCRQLAQRQRYGDANA